MPSPNPPGATQPSPDGIMQALLAYQQTAVLKTAIGLDVFTQIGEGRGTLPALAAASHASERGLRILCDRLAVMGLLRKQEDHYQLTPDSAAFLNRRSPAYLGSVADFLASDMQLESFARLPEAVRKGGSALPDDPALQPNSPQWVNFARNMATLQRLPSQALAELLLPKPTDHCKVLDVAAGHGMFGIAMALRNPKAEVYALDWPKVLTVAQENAAAAGVADRLHLIPGSAFEVELGEGYDWVLLPNFLHHFDVATCEGFLRRVRAALGPEGEVAVVEFVMDEDRLGPANAAFFPSIMLASTPSGDAYTYSEFDAMFRNAGFSETELHPLPPSFSRVVIATP